MLRAVALLFLIPILTCFAMTSVVHAGTDADFQKRIAANTRAFGIAREGLRQATEFARSRPDPFTPEKNRKKELLSRQEKLAERSAYHPSVSIFMCGGLQASAVAVDGRCVAGPPRLRGAPAALAGPDAGGVCERDRSRREDG